MLRSKPLSLKPRPSTILFYALSCVCWIALSGISRAEQPPLAIGTVSDYVGIVGDSPATLDPFSLFTDPNVNGQPVVQLAFVLGGTTPLLSGTQSVYVVMDGSSAPNTVANFLSYVDSSAYNNSIIHYSSPGFILQGGGFGISSSNAITTILEGAMIENEFSSDHLNLRGTIAMAKVDGQPDSATSQWFFNLANNASLDAANGGSTTFGHVLGLHGMEILDAISGVPVYNKTNLNPEFASLPLINYSASRPLYPEAVRIASAQQIHSTLSITAAASNPGVIHFSANGNALLITPVKGGTVSTVTIQATSLYDGQTASVSFNVASKVAFGFTSPEYRFAASGKNAEIGVRLSGSAVSPTEIDYATANGTGIAGKNYKATSGKLVFAPGEVYKTFGVPIFAANYNATVQLAISCTSANATPLSSATNATLVIPRDLPGGVFSFSPDSYRIDQGLAENLTVVRTGNVGKAASVTVDLVDGSGFFGVDYGVVPPSASRIVLTFAPGIKSKTIEAGFDSAIKSNKTFSAQLVTAAAGSALGSPNKASVTGCDLKDNPAGVFEFSQIGQGGTKSAPTAKISVKRVLAMRAASVSYSETNGSAVAGLDYVAKTGTLSFAKGVKTLSFEVPFILSQRLQNTRRQFTATIFNPTGGAGIGAANTATVGF